MGGIDGKQKDRAKSAEEVELGGQQGGRDFFRACNPGSDHPASGVVDGG